jgi:hypothetical protein
MYLLMFGSVPVRVKLGGVLVFVHSQTSVLQSIQKALGILKSKEQLAETRMTPKPSRHAAPARMGVLPIAITHPPCQEKTCG